jgi:hypothetical protein
MYTPLQKPQYYTTTTNYNYVYDKLRTDISNRASVTNYNLYNRSLAKKIYCQCIQNKYNKAVPQSNATYPNLSQQQRIAQTLNAGTGGSTQYGNFYLGKPLTINYLGRTEGQPGGGGMPPKNKY